jgi:hypothetical protein
MEYDEGFINFLKILFCYQYTIEEIELDGSISRLFYNLSKGSKSIVVALFIESQRRAILNGYKKVNEDIIIRTFEDIFGNIKTNNDLKANQNFGGLKEKKIINVDEIKSDTLLCELLKISNNANTITIGAQNTAYCHIYNSANIPFIVNKSILCASAGDLGSTSYPFSNLYLTTNINLRTPSSSSDDSGDIVWYYGNGKEKSRLWTANDYTSKSGPQYRVYKSDGTSLYSGTLPLADGTGASGTWGISVSGNAATATTATNLTNFKVTTNSNLGIDAPGANAIGYVSGLTKSAWNYQNTDGALYTQFYNSNWLGEIYQDYRTGRISVRGKNNGTWQDWLNIADATEYPTGTRYGSNGTTTKIKIKINSTSSWMLCFVVTLYQGYKASKIME